MYVVLRSNIPKKFLQYPVVHSIVIEIGEDDY